MDGCRGAQHRLRLQQDQAAARSASEIHAGLEQPAWKGRWGGAPAKADFQAIVSALLQLKGEQATAQWLAGMKANAKIYNDNIATMKAVNAGEVDGGIIYHYYWFRDQANTKEGSGNTALHYFKNEDPGRVRQPVGRRRAESSKKQEQAQQFIKFVTGKAGQEVLEKGTSFEYPVGQRRARQPACRRSTRCRRPRWTRRPGRPEGDRPDDEGGLVVGGRSLPRLAPRGTGFAV